MNQPEDLDHPLSPLHLSGPSQPVAGPEATSGEDEFACELTHALRHVAPPEGFAERTLARLDPPTTANARLLRMKVLYQQRLWACGALAATLLASAIFTEQTHIRHQRERRKAELAEQQFEAAMRITGNTLRQVSLQLQQSGITLGN